MERYYVAYSADFKCWLVFESVGATGSRNISPRFGSYGEAVAAMEQAFGGHA